MQWSNNVNPGYKNTSGTIQKRQQGNTYIPTYLKAKAKYPTHFSLSLAIFVASESVNVCQLKRVLFCSIQRSGKESVGLSMAWFGRRCFQCPLQACFGTLGNKLL